MARTATENNMDFYLPEHIRTGVYSNVASITATNTEITILFMQKDREGTNPVSKIILPAAHVRSLVAALTDSLDNIEKQIKDLEKK